MKRAHSVVVGARSWLAGHAGALIVGLAVVWMTSAPRPAWGQSAWPSYPNNNAISVTSGGNVGIGTTSPNYPLDVANRLVNVSGNIPGYLISDTQASGRQWAIFSGHPAVGYFKIRDNSPSGGDRLVIDTNGNVGIGTTNPQHLLHVAGTIGAEEVLVTSTGADYVFQPGYRLQPLSEVAAYIQANHHLPGIPSEAEVKQKGMGVGEMEAKLLAKVEELTLHMIQAQKENQELRDRLARLEKGANAAPTAAR
ncbi:MAG: hypothetical protein ABSC05_32150 [Candidatus Solibacter sp.]